MRAGAIIAAVFVSSARGADVPSWPATYDMRKSTAFMPCNYSGYFDPGIAAQWGIADFDWSNGKADWANAKVSGGRVSLHQSLGADLTC